MRLFQPLLQFPIMLQPPKGCVRKKQKIAALGDERFQLRNRVGAVRRIITSINTIFVLRKVPCFALLKLDQFFVPFTDHNECGLRRHRRVYHSPNLFDGFVVLGRDPCFKHLACMALRSKRRHQPIVFASVETQFRFRFGKLLAEFLHFCCPLSSHSGSAFCWSVRLGAGSPFSHGPLLSKLAVTASRKSVLKTRSCCCQGPSVPGSSSSWINLYKTHSSPGVGKRMYRDSRWCRKSS